MQNGSWPWDGMVLAFGLLFRGLMVSFIGAALVLRDISRKRRALVRGGWARRGGKVLKIHCNQYPTFEKGEEVP